MVGQQRARTQSNPAPSHGCSNASPNPGQPGSWYCVYTQPRKESLAAENLEIQSYQCFLPTITKTVRHARKSTRIKAALFPRYLFVHVDIGVRAWRPIRSTIGVTELVLQNERPKPVPNGVVERLLAAVNDDGHVDFRDDIEVGQDVRLLSGPFFNLVGTLQRMDDRGRVEVLLTILGGERSVFANKTALQRVAA